MALPLISPLTKYTGQINAATPFTYPGKRCCFYFHSFCVIESSLLQSVQSNINASFHYSPNAVPVRDDGNMPDVPAHPREPQGNNLQWLKNL